MLLKDVYFELEIMMNYDFPVKPSTNQRAYCEDGRT